jgi:hypothetical protein
MLGGFGASGGITGSKLGGGVVVGGGTRLENQGFDVPEVVSDLCFMLLEEGSDNGANDPVLIDLRLIPHQQVVVDPG